MKRTLAPVYRYLIEILVISFIFMAGPTLVIADGTSSEILGQNGYTVMVDKALMEKTVKMEGQLSILPILITGKQQAVKVVLSREVVSSLVYDKYLIHIQTPDISYDFPAAEIKTAKLADQLNVNLQEIEINIFLTRVKPEEATSLMGNLTQRGFRQAAKLWEAKILASAAGKTIEINSFDSYIMTQVTLDQMVDVNKAVGVFLGDTPIPAPTQFAEKDGKIAAVIKHRTNGILTVIEGEKSFADMLNHWAGEEVNTLAAKGVISGTGENTFAPENRVTRAQYASFLARALGLESSPSTARFKDVPDSAWYAGTVGAVASAGIVNGYSDVAFRPNAYVTREEAAVMLVQAIGKLGLGEIPAEAESSLLLNQVIDRKYISPWATRWIGAALKLNIIAGDSNGYLTPGKTCTRAEAAVMVKNFMGRAGLITAVKLKAPVDHMKTNRASIKISGKATVGSRVAVNGTPTVVDAGGSFSCYLVLKQGSNAVSVEFTDVQGNTVTLKRSVTYDPLMSGIDITTPRDNLLTNRSPITVTGTASEGSRVTVNGVVCPIDSDGNFSKVIGLNQGKNNIMVSAVDQDGSENSITRTVTYDSIAPELIVISPTGKQETGNDVLIVTGYTEAGCIVKIDGHSVMVDRDGNFSEVLDLSVDSNMIPITAVDAAGNVSSVTRAVIFNDNRVTQLSLADRIKLGSSIGIKYAISMDGYVTVKVLDEERHRLRTILDNVFKVAGSYGQSWDGLDSDGDLVPDGNYIFVVELRDENQDVIGRAETGKPTARVPKISVETDDEQAYLSNDQLYSISYEIDSEALVFAAVYRGGRPVRAITANELKSPGTHSIIWDGLDEEGNPVPDGQYTINIESISPFISTFKTFYKANITVERLAPAITGVVLNTGVINIGTTRLTMSYSLSEDCTVSVLVNDKNGNPVYSLYDVRQKVGNNRISWDGKGNNGRLISAGAYNITLIAVDNYGKAAPQLTKSFTAQQPKPGDKNKGLPGYLQSISPPAVGLYGDKPITLLEDAEVSDENGEPADVAESNTAPQVTNFTVSPTLLKIGTGRLSVRYTLDKPAKVTVKVKDNSGNLVRTILDGVFRTIGSSYCTWDGNDQAGNYIGEGVYTVTISAVDEAGLDSGEQSAQFTTGYVPTIQNVVVTPNPFNPQNENGEQARVSFNLSYDAAVTIKVLNSRRALVRTLTSGPITKGAVTVNWDGKDANNNLVGDDTYSFTIEAVSLVVPSFKVVENAAITVENELPKITNYTVSPSLYKIGGSNLSIRYALSEPCTVTVKIVDSSGKLVCLVLNGVSQKAGSNSVSWNGKDDAGSEIIEGPYVVQISAMDNFNKPAVQQVISFTAGYQSAVNDIQISLNPFNPSDPSTPQATINYSLSKDARVTLKILNYRRVPVAVLISDELQSQGAKTIAWDGRDDLDQIVADGIYYVQLVVTSTAVNSFKTTSEAMVTVEKQKPTIANLILSPGVFYSYKKSSLNIRYNLSENANVSVFIYRGGNLVKVILNGRAQNAGTNGVQWDGTDDFGNKPPKGTYAIVVRAVDTFGKTVEIKGNITYYPSFAVDSTDPENASTGFVVDNNIVITFNDSARKGEDFNRIKLQVNDRDVQFTMRIAGKTLTLIPSANMAYGTKYTVTVPKDAVTDALGQSLGGPFALTFTTESAPRPGAAEVVNLTGSITTTNSNSDKESLITVTVDGKSALVAIDQDKNAKTVLIPVTTAGGKVNVEIPGEFVRELANRNIAISVSTPKASLTVPAAQLKLGDLVRQTGADLKDVKVTFSLSFNEPANASLVTNLAKKQKITTLAEPVSFRVQVFTPETAIEVSSFKRYCELAVYLPAGSRPGSTGGLMVYSDGRFRPVPALVRTENGKTAVILKARTSGVFSVIRAQKSFRDTVKHWAQGDIDTLTAKMIVNGVSENTFSPNSKVTRAQFITMIVQALGLTPGTAEIAFTDVKPGSWYAESVAAAIEAGIIQGYPDGTFRPNAYITREEACILIINALEAAGISLTLDEGNVTSQLSKFKDQAGISYWAKDSVAAAAQNSIVRGYHSGSFGPAAGITRAECVVMVKNLLVRAGLI